MIISAEGPGNSLDFYRAVNGTSTWNPEVVAGSGSIKSAPVIAAVDAIASIDDEPGDWWSNREAPDSTAASSPAVTINGGDINIAFIGGDGNLHFIWSAGDSVWSDDWPKETVDTAANL